MWLTRCLPPIDLPPPPIAHLLRTSLNPAMYKLNRRGDKSPPCRTPLDTDSLLDNVAPQRTYIHTSNNMVRTAASSGPLLAGLCL